jgi:hypothetical protein
VSCEAPRSWSEVSCFAKRDAPRLSIEEKEVGCVWEVDIGGSRLDVGNWNLEINISRIYYENSNIFSYAALQVLSVLSLCSFSVSRSKELMKDEVETPTQQLPPDAQNMFSVW